MNAALLPRGASQFAAFSSSRIVGGIALAIVAGLVALFITGYVLTIGDYVVPKTVAQDPSIPHITLNGATFRAETFGDPAKPTVIVLHGGPGTGEHTWMRRPIKAGQGTIAGLCTFQYSHCALRAQ